MRRLHRLSSALALGVLLTMGAWAQTPSSPPAATQDSSTTSAPVTETGPRAPSIPLRTLDLEEKSPLEKFYSTAVPGPLLRQFGYDAVSATPSLAPTRGRTPEPYVLGPGDHVSVYLWGDPVDLGELPGEWTTKVNEDGSLFYAPVGLVNVDGALRSDVEKRLESGLSKKYKRFSLKVQVSSRRAFSVTVTGRVVRPGPVVVDSWTSILDLLALTGGVAKNGTLRDIKLIKADGREFSIDLYQQLVSAQKTPMPLEEGDALWVGPIGSTVAVAGEVKVPGIYELRGEESLAQVLPLAGGVLVSAKGSPMTHWRRDADNWNRCTEVWTTELLSRTPVADGDVVQFAGASGIREVDRSKGFVRINGEVGRPGWVEWHPGMTVQDGLQKVGGVLDTGYVAGVVLKREGVVAIQRKQVEAALATNKQQIALLESKLSRETDAMVLIAVKQELGARTEAGILLTQSLTDDSLGRIQLDSRSREPVPLQAGDSVFVPKRDGVVLVLGEVFNPGAQIWTPGLSLKAAIEATGGAKSSGDWDGVYILRSSGRVESVRARGNFLGMSWLWGERLEPGDIVYVPNRSADSAEGWVTIKESMALIAQTTSTTVSVYALLVGLGVL